MSILFVVSETHLAGVGGGVTHTRGMLKLFESIEGATIHRLAIPLPFAKLPRNIRRARALVRGLLTGEPSKTHYLLDRAAAQLFQEMLDSQTFDVVVLNGADLLPLARQVGGGTKCVLISHNVETKILRGQVAQLRVPAMVRKILQHDIENTYNMEIDGVRRMALIIAISHADAEWYRRLLPDTEVMTVPSAFAYEPYCGPRSPVTRPLQAAYLAKLSWWPNREGAEWFADSVLSKLPAGTIEAHFFGPGSEDFHRRHPALRGHGFVDSLDTVWSSVSFTLCPILTGSGINIKLVESLYNRVPVLATPHACRGLPPISDPALAVVPPEDWPAFLQSERAVALASSRVRKETADLFAARNHVDILSSSINNILSSTQYNRT